MDSTSVLMLVMAQHCRKWCFHRLLSSARPSILLATHQKTSKIVSGQNLSECRVFPYLRDCPKDARLRLESSRKVLFLWQTSCDLRRPVSLRAPISASVTAAGRYRDSLKIVAIRLAPCLVPLTSRTVVGGTRVGAQARYDDLVCFVHPFLLALPIISPTLRANFCLIEAAAYFGACTDVVFSRRGLGPHYKARNKIREAGCICSKSASSSAIGSSWIESAKSNSSFGGLYIPTGTHDPLAILYFLITCSIIISLHQRWSSVTPRHARLVSELPSMHGDCHQRRPAFSAAAAPSAAAVLVLVRRSPYRTALSASMGSLYYPPVIMYHDRLLTYLVDRNIGPSRVVALIYESRYIVFWAKGKLTAPRDRLLRTQPSFRKLEGGMSDAEWVTAV